MTPKPTPEIIAQIAATMIGTRLLAPPDTFVEFTRYALDLREEAAKQINERYPDPPKPEPWPALSPIPFASYRCDGCGMTWTSLGVASSAVDPARCPRVSCEGRLARRLDD
jgi:hypothetical protein